MRVASQWEGLKQAQRELDRGWWRLFVVFAEGVKHQRL